jgi:hypothetical protein
MLVLTGLRVTGRILVGLGVEIQIAALVGTGVKEKMTVLDHVLDGGVGQSGLCPPCFYYCLEPVNLEDAPIKAF